MLAYDFPLLSLMLSIAWFFVWVILVITIFRVMGAIFRDPEMSGVAKAVWLVVILFLPFVGTFAYVITRGDNLSTAPFEARSAYEAGAQGYIRP
jgi:hypothetical protein